MNLYRVECPVPFRLKFMVSTVYADRQQPHSISIDMGLHGVRRADCHAPIGVMVFKSYQQKQYFLFSILKLFI